MSSDECSEEFTMLLWESGQRNLELAVKVGRRALSRGLLDTSKNAMSSHWTLAKSALHEWSQYSVASNARRLVWVGGDLSEKATVTELFDLLMASGASSRLNEPSVIRGKPPLTLSILSDSKCAFDSLLAHPDTDINVREFDSERTPLMVAIKLERRFYYVERLLERYWDIDFTLTDINGRTVFELADALEYQFYAQRVRDALNTATQIRLPHYKTNLQTILIELVPKVLAHIILGLLNLTL